MFFILFKNRLRIYINHFIKSSGSKRLRIVMMGLAWFVFIQFLFPILLTIFQLLIENQQLGKAAAVQLLAVILFGLLIALLMSSMVICIYTLFVSKDLPLLLSTPISRTTLFTYKLVEATISNSSIFLLLGLPIIITFGMAIEAGFLYYILAIPLCIIFLFIPTSFSSLISLFLVRIVPAKRAREIMSAVLAAVFIAIWTGLQFLRSSFTEHAGSFDPNQISSISNVITNDFFFNVPSGWLAQSLMSFAENDFAQGIFSFAVLFCFTAGLFFASLILVETLYYRGHGSMESRIKIKPQKLKTLKVRHERAQGHQSLFLTIMKRDYRLITRDLAQFMQYFMFAIMIVVMAIIFKQDVHVLSHSYLASLEPYIFVFIFSVINATAMGVRLVPIEGMAFYINMISPQRGSLFMNAKVMLSWILGNIVAILGVLVVTFIHKMPFVTFLGALLFAIAICLSSSGIGIYLGISFANFDWDHPKRMISVGGSLISGFIPLLHLFLVASIGIACMIVLQYLGLDELFSAGVGILISIILNVATSWLCSMLASRRVSDLSWQY